MKNNGGKRPGAGRKKGGTNRSSPLSFIYEDLVGSFKFGSFYVYTHSWNGRIFYIGKGSGGRAWDCSASSRNELWKDFTNKINKDYSIRIIAANLSERQALAVESALISVEKPICNIKMFNFEITEVA